MHSGKRRKHRKDGLGFEQLEPRLAMAVVINEFLAVNSSGLQDQDGDRSDWIELYNPGPAGALLTGWHLSDDAGDLSKWTFPAVNIPAGGYLLVFASGKDRAVAGQELHTNFSLAEEGESLLLVMPDGTTVADAFAPYPEQAASISYGRGSQSTTTDSLIAEFGQLKVLVPTNNSVDVGVAATPWTALAFNDAAWASGNSGVGYDNNGTGQNLATYVDTNVSAQMNSATRPTAYIRMPFQVANPADLSTLTLRIRYDDGIAVYLNGTEISSARRNAGVGALGFSSSATASHSDTAAIVYEDVDLTASKNLLLPGSNVLAIHGLNRTSSTTNIQDFLIDPLLQADRILPAVTGYMATPSPNAANQAGTLGVVADTNFSVDRGFYTSPFTVDITTATPDAEIRYTTDGSPPTATTGLIYNPASPPLIVTTTTLRAAAFRTGWTPTNVDTQTYIFLDDVIQQDGVGLPPVANWGWVGPDWAVDPDVVNNPLYSGEIINDLKAVPTVSLVMPWDDWFGGAGVGIYPTESEIERATSMEFFTADGSEQFQIDAGIEVQGGTSDDRWKVDKLSLRVKFKEPYGPEKLDADIFHSGARDEGAAVSFNTLILDAHLGYAWPYGGGVNPVDQRSRAMYVQDDFVSDLQNLAGGAAPHGRFVHLYINGLYWGMYDMHERADEHFAQSYFGGADEDYDVIKHTSTTVVSADPNNPNSALENYAAMLALVRQDMTVPANYAAAAAKVDVDDLITYMIVNYYVGNDDWAHHNWYATYNRVDPEGKWRFHSWDAENVLKNVNYNAIQTGGFTGTPEEVHLLLIANDEYRLRFADLVHKHFNNTGLMTPASAAAIYQARMSEVEQAIVGESARWGDSHTTATDPPGAGNPYLLSHWTARQNDLLTNYFPIRTGVVQGQFNARGWNVSLAAPLLSQFGGEVMAGYALTLSKPGGSPAAATIYYTLDGSDPRDPATNLPSATAIPYAGPITINAGQRVQARIYNDGAGSSVNEWSPVSDATFLLPTPFPLRIVELNYNPAPFPGVGDAQSLEFFELLNTGSQPISLDGVHIAEFATTPYQFPDGLMLSAGQRIIVANNVAAFQTAYGTGHNVSPLGYATANLSNGGERVKLLGPVGETLQDFTYSDAGGWPGAADGNGKSLEIVDPLGNPGDSSNWRASYSHGGSPGESGNPPATPGDFNGDGHADGADFLAWQRGLGTPALQGTTAKGDANGDRAVDAADLALWAGDYGATPAVAAAASASITTTTTASSVPVLASDEWIFAAPSASGWHARGGPPTWAWAPTESSVTPKSALLAPLPDVIWQSIADQSPRVRTRPLAEQAAVDAAHDADSPLDCELAAWWRTLRRAT